MQPMLDSLALPQVQEIVTLERRVLAGHKPPGMEGSLLQNMGRRPLRLSLWGVALGTDVQNFIQKLDDKFRAGKPLPFTADIVADSRVDKVLVEDLQVREVAGTTQRYAYVLILREYIEPIEPDDVSGVDANALADAQNLTDNLIPGLMAGAGFATGLERFVAPLTGMLGNLQQFNRQTGQQPLSSSSGR